MPSNNSETIWRWAMCEHEICDAAGLGFCVLGGSSFSVDLDGVEGSGRPSETTIAGRRTKRRGHSRSGAGGLTVGGGTGREKGNWLVRRR